MAEERTTNLEGGADTPAKGPCVILVSRGSREPTSLVEGLGRRGALTRVVADESTAILELARSAASALIVAEPRGVRRLAELLTAVRTYYPRVVCWQYESIGRDGEPQLTPLPTAAAPTGTAPAATKPGPAAPNVTATRAAPIPPASTVTATRPSPSDPALNEQATAPLISAEELSMLLDPLPPQDDSLDESTADDGMVDIEDEDDDGL